MKSVDVIHALRYPGRDDQYVALDRNSGGYPDPVRASRAHDFRSKEDAIRYQEMFKDKNFKYAILEVFDHTIEDGKENG